MSNANAPRFEEVHPQEEFHDSPLAMPTSGLLTPPVLYNMDTRRDSSASSHTTMSFGSCVSELSMPVTPTYAASPLHGRGFPNVISYEAGQELQDQFPNSLPIDSKAYDTDHNMYGAWALGASDALMSPPVATHASRVHPHTGSYFETHMAHPLDLDVPMVSSVNSSWASLSTNAHPEPSRQWNGTGSSFGMPEGGTQTFWTDRVQFGHASHVVQPPAAMADIESDYVHIAPSTSMIDIENDWDHVVPPSFCDSEPFEDLGQHLAHSPQEVSFKHESSPSPVKREPELEDAEAIRLTRSIHVSSTGGKTVKKEQSAYPGTNRPRRNRKSNRAARSRSNFQETPHTVFIGGTKVVVEHSNVLCKWDDEAKKVMHTETRTQQSKYACRKCTREFARQEHLVRHEKTHDGRKDFHCRFCVKSFDRRDNCVAHLNTHVKKPGQNGGRNRKWSLEQIKAGFPDDIKMQEKIQNMYEKSLRAPK